MSIDQALAVMALDVGMAINVEGFGALRAVVSA